MSSKALFYFSIIFLNLGIFIRGEAQDLEQTFIITDQPYYQTGSQINYNLYLYNPEEGKEKVPSQTAYVELLDEYGKILYNHKHDVRSGSSPGQFETDKIDSSGWFWIRAYTFYQIGFCDELIHYIPVYLVSPEDIRKNPDREIQNPQIPDFSIFIDGGRILEDINNTIVIRSKSSNGTGKSLNAWIINNQNGDSLKNFGINPDGTGSCILKGKPISDYSLLITDGDNNMRVIEFPEPESKRCVVRVSDSPGASQLFLSLNFDENYDQYKNVEVFTRGKFSDRRLQKIRIRNKIENLVVEKDNLYPGENIIFISADGYGIIGQKTIFIHESKENNLFILKDKLMYIPRQHLSGNIRLTNPAATEVPADLSILVRDTEQFEDFVTGYPATYTHEQNSYQNLSYYVSGSLNEDQWSDQLLKENYIIGDLKGELRLVRNQPVYNPEQELALRGKVVDDRTGEPLSVRALTFTQTGENPGYNFQFTDRDGNFEFDDIYFHNRNNELILNIGEDERILLDTLHIKPDFDPPPVIGNIWTNPTFLNFIAARGLDQ